MRLFVIFFLLGDIFLQQFSTIPSFKWIFFLVLLSPLSYYLFRNYPTILKIQLAILLGFLWTFTYAHHLLSWTIPPALEGKPLQITGYIASIPSQSKEGTHFLFQTKKLEYSHQSEPLNTTLKLSWRKNQIPLQVGDKWQLTVRLKRIYGTFNPGGYDYEAWAFQEGIRAAGYVVNHGINQHLPSSRLHFLLSRIRQAIKTKIEQTIPVTQTSPWISALSVGERQGVNESDWQVLRNTGTNHLMAIAGLHIGFMAAFAHFVVAWLWRRIPRVALYFPALHAGAIAALTMALLYSAMAGFSIPTQRACIMLSAFLITLLMRRKMLAWQAYCIAMLGVLLINPLSVLTDSFWLSFGSVALIIYGVSSRLSPKGFWWKWGRIQWVIAIGLIPLSIALFHQSSFTSFVANSIAIPWVGFLVVPLCLFGSLMVMISAKMGGFILMLADKLLGYLWLILTWFAYLPGMVWYQVVLSPWVIITAILSMLFFLIPIGMPGRYLGIIWLLPLMLFTPKKPAAGELWITLLDVGQGLSTVIQTAHHVLVFDAGLRFNPTFDMGDSVVVPYLRSIGTKKVDMLVISHGDNDHSGGANAIIHQFPVSAIRTSVPELFPNTPVNLCLRGMQWEWDKVKFKFLYPPSDKLHLNNNSSCVLRIEAGSQAILLTGDIEKLAEYDLLKNVPNQLPATLLIAPHHGSKTSAVKEFVKTVHPRYVLFPLGYRNRYHFPHVSVVERYHEINSELFDTAKMGAIEFYLGQNLSYDFFRQSHHHYWNNGS